MKNKKITVPKEDINTSTGALVYCTVNGSTPKNIYFTNSCGKGVEINFISNEELLEYRTDDTNFVGIGVANSDVFSSKDIINEDPDRMINYLTIKKSESGDATDDLDIYCVDYV